MIDRLPMRDITCHVCGKKHMDYAEMEVCNYVGAENCPNMIERGPTPTFADDFPMHAPPQSKKGRHSRWLSATPREDVEMSEWKNWRCPHGLGVGEIKKREGCPECLADLRSAPDPVAMTAEDRVAEMRRYDSPLCVPFSELHKRIEALVGRPVWTHEFASSLWDLLVEEARTQQHATMDTVIDRAQMLMGDKPVIVLRQDKP